MFPIPLSYSVGNAVLPERYTPVLGGVLWLAQHSVVHQRYSVSVLLRRILPSLELDQFRYYTQKGKPIGFVNWAKLSHAVAEKFATGNYHLVPSDWQSGSELWFPEILAPFGHGQQILWDLRSLFPEGTTGKAVYVNSDGSFRRIQTYR